MNNPSLKAFEPRLQPKGLLLLNSSLITHKIARNDVEVIEIPANDIAAQIGEKRTANMVMLGAYIARTKIVHKEGVLEGLREFFGKKIEFLDVNMQAFEKGMEYGKY